MRTMRQRLLTVLVGLLGWAVPAFAQIQPFNYWVPPDQCTSIVSGNSTGTNGQTVIGASNTPVVQASTSDSGTNTHTYICNINPPVRLINSQGNRIQLLDAVFFYGEQSNISNSQATVASAGTFNGSIVFSYIQYPNPGASETASAVTPVRADSGNLGLTPAVTAINYDTLTAGRFYSLKFAPATPIVWNTDLRQLLMTVTLKLPATSATVTQSPGVLVHVRTN